MKKIVIALLLATIVISCDTKDQEVTIGTNNLVVGEETFIEVKSNKMHTLNVYSLHPKDSIFLVKDVQKKMATIVANKVGTDTIVVEFIFGKVYMLMLG